MKKIKNVLFVCTGNTCRSPMAQALFQDTADREGLGCESSSAGIAVGAEGEPATAEAVNSVKKLGIDLSGHKSKSIRSLELNSIDLFAAMTLTHAEMLMNLGVPKNKIYVMEIPDPYGGNQEIYDKCCAAIKSSVEHLARLIKENNE